MMSGSAGDWRRWLSSRTGRLVWALAAVIAALAGGAVVASAQPTEPRAPNPPLGAACGLKVALVLDESASIISPGPGITDQTPTVRAAANGFVDALTDTGSQLAVMAFSVSGRPGVPVPAGSPQTGYEAVTPSSANTFHQWIGGTAVGDRPGYQPTTGAAHLGTNWEDGFNQVARTPGGPPNLVVFVTDGLPNHYMVNGTPTLLLPDGNDTVMNAAIAGANRLKTGEPPVGPSRIFALGVGPATEDTAGQDRLKLISGDTEFRPGVSGFTESDWAAIDFDQLKGELTGIVSELCGGRLLITKDVVDHTGQPVDASGWRFTTTLTPEGGHTWLAPSEAGTDPTASLFTNAEGMADFQWRLHAAEHRVTVSHTHETDRPGFHFVEATCRTEGSGGPNGAPEVSTTGIPGATLGEGDFRTCEVLNRTSMANLTVVKSLEPLGDPGRFNLHIAGVADQLNVTDGGSTGPHSLPLGPYTVSETAGQGTDLSDYNTKITCVSLANDQEDVTEHTGTSVQVHLTSDGEDVVCTIHNVSTKFGEITVIKHLIPTNDPGRFNLLVGGNTEAHAVTDGGHTPAVVLPFGPHEVTETGANGTDLGHYNISTTCIDESTGDTVGHNPHGPAVSVTLSRQVDNIQCTIENERPGVKVGRLEVVKHLVPHDDAGRFDLLIGGRAFALGVRHNGSTGPLDFELGTHTVTEHGVHGTHLADFAISTTCVDKAHGNHQVAHNAHGPQVSVHLNSESDNIVCTITNTRTAPPGEGGGEVPETPGPHLGVIKTMPAHAQVGELVPISVVVHNLGHGVAHGVQLHENRPAGMQIVHVADHGTIEHNGTAVWHLGDLAPGESRTVHATARVLHTGLHVDTAVATALNADPALSDAAVRAARRPRPPHRPTPPPPVVTG